MAEPKVTRADRLNALLEKAFGANFARHTFVTNEDNTHVALVIEEQIFREMATRERVDLATGHTMSESYAVYDVGDRITVRGTNHDAVLDELEKRLGGGDGH